MGESLWIRVEMGYCNGFHGVEPSQYGAIPLEQARRNAKSYAEVLGAGRISIVKRQGHEVETVEVIQEA